jgi:hypothetical protein
MLTLYCAKCGGKNHYTVKKPSFCSDCGVPFNTSAASLASTSQKTPIPQPAKTTIRAIELEEEPSLPDIKKIAIDFKPDRPNIVRFGDVAETRLGQEPERRRAIPKRISKKQVLEELKAESQSSPRRQTIGDSDGDSDGGSE